MAENTTTNTMIWDKVKNIALIVLGIICIALLLSTTCANQKNRQYEENIEAYKDSIHTLHLSNGELLAYKKSFMDENKNLHEYLNMSKKEYKELEKKLNEKIDYISELESNIRVDSIVMHDSVYIGSDSTIIIPFSYSDKWIALGGETTVFDSTCAETKIDSIKMDIPLVVGFDRNNKFFAETENPYVNFTSINSAVSTKNNKPKRWNVGVQVGVGAQYDLIHKTFGIGPYVGVGIAYGFDF